jgi:hypothetical protein
VRSTPTNPTIHQVFTLNPEEPYLLKDIVRCFLQIEEQSCNRQKKFKTVSAKELKK